MTRSITATLLLLTLFTGFSCRRSQEIPAPQLTGQLVEFAGCSHYVVKVLSGPITDSSVLVPTWTDTSTQVTYSNVFSVKNWINFQQAGVALGDTFTFTLNGAVPDSNQTYYTCMIRFFNMPAVYNNVTNVQLIGHTPQIGI